MRPVFFLERFYSDFRNLYIERNANKEAGKSTIRNNLLTALLPTLFYRFYSSSNSVQNSGIPLQGYYTTVV